jgi:hypothetical protein
VPVSAVERVSERGISFGGFAIRFVFALFLVYATYNPWGYSYVAWISGNWSPDDASSWFASPALKFVIGIALAIAWVVYGTAARRSLGGVGILLVVALCAGLIWLLVEQGVFSMENVPTLTHVALWVVSAVMAIGMSWSHVRRRLSGQVDTDEVDTN